MSLYVEMKKLQRRCRCNTYPREHIDLDGRCHTCGKIYDIEMLDVMDNEIKQLQEKMIILWEELKNEL